MKLASIRAPGRRTERWVSGHLTLQIPFQDQLRGTEHAAIRVFLSICQPKTAG